MPINITINGRTIYALRYTHRRWALDAMYRAERPMRTILGDNGKYWVVTPADAERLVAAGYERI